MFRNIFTQLYSLVFRPAETWEKMADNGEAAHSLFFSRFLFPIMGMVALSCFVDLIGEEFNAETIERVLKISIIEFVKFFISFYLIVFLWKQFASQLSLPHDKEVIERFVGYLLSLYMAVEIIVNILPRGFSFLSYASLGLVYIVWTGAGSFLHIDESRKRLFSLAVTILILITPIVIARIFYMIMPLSY